MGYRICLILILSSMLAACGSGSSSSSDAAAAAAGISVTPSPGSTTPGGTISIVPTGGTPPYTFTMSAAFGTLSLPSGAYTVYTAPSSDGVATILITDSAANQLTYYVDVVGAALATTLQISPTDTSVALGGTVVFSATGGTAPYTYSVVTGGGSFSSNVYTAPSSIETVTVEVTDSLNAMSQTTVYVGTAAAGTGVSCEGTYTVNDAGQTGTLTLVEDSSGKVAGALDIVISGQSNYFPITGTCTVSGTTGTFNFTNPSLGETYTGTVTYSGTQISLSGSIASTAYIWTATAQSTAPTIPAASQTCDGTYNANIDGTLGSMDLVSDGSNFIGQLMLPYQGADYYYVLAGTCSVTAGTISFMDYTTGSTYTGSIGIVGGTSINMTGGFTEPGTACTATNQCGWSATP